MTIKVRERELSQIVDALNDFSKHFWGTQKETYGYLLCGQQLRPVKSSGLIPFVLSNLLRPRRWPRAYIRLPFRAGSIRVKNNLRLFDCGQDQELSVKLTLPGLLRDGSLRREIRARRIYAGPLRPSFDVPAIRDYDKPNGRWIAEDMVVQGKDGRSLVDEFITDHALDFYRATCRLQKIANRKIYGMSISEITDFLPNNKSCFELDKFQSAKLPTALCHGDLSAGNMMRDQQGILFVVDWEKARVMPVAADLRKLYTRYPQARSDILQILTTLSSEDPHSAPPEVQMSLVLAADSALSEKNRDKMVQYYMQARGMGAKRAHKHFEDAMLKNQALIQELSKNVLK